MPRAIWTGAISFGLVTVPVRLYSAVSRKTVRFHQLNKDTGLRIAQKRVDPSTGEEVAYDDIVKGYEIAPDRYVIVEPSELEALDPERTRTIDIEEFVDLDEIDPILYDHPYYLAPGPGGAKPYRLLLEAMKQSNKVAIAKVVIRSKESLVAVRPMGDVLAMSTMLFADEVNDPGRLDDVPDPKDIKTTPKELAIAKQLLESLAGEFEPERYHDEYREKVLDLIDRKAAGKKVAIQPALAEEPSEVPDLMSALQASLAEVRKRSGGGGAADRTSRMTKPGTKKKAPAKSRSSNGRTKAKSGS